MSKNGIQLNSRGNGFKLSGLGSLTYYPEIPRTSDLLKTSEFSVGASPDLQISKFYIAPATIRLDDLVEEALFDINRILSKKIEKPSGDHILSESIAKIIELYGKNVEQNELRDHLISEGHTGTLIKVASNLNASRIDQITRAILSEEGIFFYLAYKAIIGHDISDVDGIGTNILESLGIVKSHINILLVNKVIDKEILDVSDAERKMLRRTISKRRISYFSGGPSKTIEQLVEELKSGGKLYKLVMNFLNSGRVKLPRNANKSELAQKMVDYLLKMGYNEDFEEADEPNNDTSQDGDSGQAQEDELQVIEGLGEITEREFKEAGITTFSEIAKYDVKGLKGKLKNTSISIRYNDIIKQAKLISKGKLVSLKELQEKLNKK